MKTIIIVAASFGIAWFAAIQFTQLKEHYHECHYVKGMPNVSSDWICITREK